MYPTKWHLCSYRFTQWLLPVTTKNSLVIAGFPFTRISLAKCCLDWALNQKKLLTQFSQDLIPHLWKKGDKCELRFNLLRLTEHFLIWSKPSYAAHEVSWQLDFNDIDEWSKSKCIRLSPSFFCIDEKIERNAVTFSACSSCLTTEKLSNGYAEESMLIAL